MVIATQNPIEMEGTYALPEAQRDRFMVRLSMGYPVEAAEIAMLSARDGVSPLEELEPVTDAAEVRKLIEVTSRRARLRGRPAVRRRAGHGHPALPRPAARRLAPRDPAPGPRRQGVGRDAGREYVLPDDVRDLAPLVLPHRLLPTMEATMSGRRTTEVVENVLARSRCPRRAGPLGKLIEVAACAS